MRTYFAQLNLMISLQLEFDSTKRLTWRKPKATAIGMIADYPTGFAVGKHR
jgi:hypothetical protein